jgi:hypothetical protein
MDDEAEAESLSSSRLIIQSWEIGALISLLLLEYSTTSSSTTQEMYRYEYSTTRGFIHSERTRQDPLKSKHKSYSRYCDFQNMHDPSGYRTNGKAYSSTCACRSTPSTRSTYYYYYWLATRVLVLK